MEHLRDATKRIMESLSHHTHGTADTYARADHEHGFFMADQFDSEEETEPLVMENSGMIMMMHDAQASFSPGTRDDLKSSPMGYGSRPGAGVLRSQAYPSAVLGSAARPSFARRIPEPEESIRVLSVDEMLRANKRHQYFKVAVPVPRGSTRV